MERRLTAILAADVVGYSDQYLPEFLMPQEIERFGKDIPARNLVR